VKWVCIILKLKRERERVGETEKISGSLESVTAEREREREKIRKKIEKVGEKREDILEGEMGEKPK